jgi:hypothetical protein
VGKPSRVSAATPAAVQWTGGVGSVARDCHRTPCLAVLTIQYLSESASSGSSSFRASG